MSDGVCTKTKEEYDDDFEKDLDWLISEGSQSLDQGPDYEDIEADIDKELEEDAKHQPMKRKENSYKVEKRENKMKELEEDEERWPSPMEPLEYDSDRDRSDKSSPEYPPPPGIDEQSDEEKKYILEKIQQANRELQDQEAPDMTRRRRLHFKETLVTLVVPPLQFVKDCTSESEEGKGLNGSAKDIEAETEVSGKLSELKLSHQVESEGGSGGLSRTGGNNEVRKFSQEDRVLVEKDGKFELVSLKEMESHGLFPPIVNNCSSQEWTGSPSKSFTSGSSRSYGDPSPFRLGINSLQTPRPPSQPRPPAQPRSRPSSAGHNQRGSQGRGTKRRVQSATGTPNQATYTLSPQQKKLLQKIQERREKLAREEEQRKLEEDEQKRLENELAFKAWLMRKREQLQEERRILRAQEMERMNLKKDPSNPEEAFRLWLQRKQEQHQREKQVVELRKMEEDSSYLSHSREECERAFKMWLTRKREQKRAEHQAAREHSRKMVLEERRARRMRDLMCSVNETKPFRFTDQLAYHF